MVKIQKPQKKKLGNKKIKKTLKKIKIKSNNSEQPENPAVPVSEPESSDSDFDPEALPELLEPYTREQLIELVSEAVVGNPSLLSFVRRHADRDVSHRKLFVHGLAWETTRESLSSAFEPFGRIEDCNVIVDKATGKCKGYGFVQFKKRKSACKALKEPKKKILNRMTSCQLASVGPTSAAKDSDQVHQKKQADVKNKSPAEPAVLFSSQQLQQQQQPQVLAALAATQNFPLLGHNNPIYGSLLGSQISPVMPVGSTSKMTVTTVPTSHVGMAGGALGGANSTLLGQFGAGQGLQHLYPNLQIGQQQEVGRGQGTTTTRAFSGYPSYICA